jgi:hypothetical protein
VLSGDHGNLFTLEKRRGERFKCEAMGAVAELEISAWQPIKNCHALFMNVELGASFSPS